MPPPPPPQKLLLGLLTTLRTAATDKMAPAMNIKPTTNCQVLDIKNVLQRKQVILKKNQNFLSSYVLSLKFFYQHCTNHLRIKTNLRNSE